MHGTWKSRAKEVQMLLDQGHTSRQIAAYYGVAWSTMKKEIGRLRAARLLTPHERPKLEGVATQPDYKESNEILSDGTHKSDKLLRMDANQCKDVDYLLRAHGFDKNAWTLINAKNNIWNTNDKVNGVQTLYSSKITVKPREQTWTYDDLVACIRDVSPITVDRPLSCADEWMIELPYYDSHFGNSDYEHYRQTQVDSIALLESRHWREAFFIVGQDTIHADNFNSTTASGTRLSDVDIPRAWAECRRFYEPLLETALGASERVIVMYSQGNHDPAMSWSFVQYLKARFPQVEVDDSVKQRKCHVFGDNFIGITHGDKARRELQLLFAAEFPHEWAQTKNREAHVGHLHREDKTSDRDGAGIMVRTLATRNKTDKWHEDEGYVGTHRRFQLFEWSARELKRIHYV